MGKVYVLKYLNIKSKKKKIDSLSLNRTMNYFTNINQ